MRDAFIARLKELADADPRIVLVTGDLGFGVFDEFRETNARQFFNAGVAEQNMTLLASGLALEGFIPFTYSIGNFPTLRCLEMIRNDAAYHELNVNIVAIGGGFSYGALGISHHATEDLAIMRSLPNVSVMAPCTLFEVQEATTAMVENNFPCYLRFDKDYGSESTDRPSFQFGKARVLRSGTDCTVVVCGGILSELQVTAESLENQGFSIEIISMPCIKPLDLETVAQSVAKTKVLVTLEEHSIHGGLGGAISEQLARDGHQALVQCHLGLEAGFSSIVGSQSYLRRRYGLDSISIERRLKSAIGSQQRNGAVES